MSQQNVQNNTKQLIEPTKSNKVSTPLPQPSYLINRHPSQPAKTVQVPCLPKKPRMSPTQPTPDTHKMALGCHRGDFPK